MEWMIEGADANTGEDVRLIVEAESSDAAEDIARGKGVMISKHHSRGRGTSCCDTAASD